MLEFAFALKVNYDDGLHCFNRKRCSPEGQSHIHRLGGAEGERKQVFTRQGRQF